MSTQNMHMYRTSRSYKVCLVNVMQVNIILTSSLDCFTRHHIDRVIPVADLVKCKMQDNLEFMQWTKRFWDAHFPGHDYEAAERRRASGPVSSVAPSPMRTSTTSRVTATTSAARRPPAASNSAASRVAPRNSSASSGGAQAAVLQAKVTELTETVTGLERERDFYFNKLRDIEVMLQQEVELKPELEREPEGLIGRLQAILYSTEEGFEIPQDGDEEFAANGAGLGPDDQETF